MNQEAIKAWIEVKTRDFQKGKGSFWRSSNEKDVVLNILNEHYNNVTTFAKGGTILFHYEGTKN